jgi:hypothetical protein
VPFKFCPCHTGHQYSDLRTAFMSDSAEQRRVKRPRTTSNAERCTTISRTYLWFDDGNIILHAESTQFRVHRSILSASSSVFRDMFSLPQPENENVVDRCPVVRVSDTSHPGLPHPTTKQCHVTCGNCHFEVANDSICMCIVHGASEK